MDHITKPASRKTLRRLASYFREMCGIKQEGVFPVLQCLEKLPDLFEGTVYCIVEDDELPAQVMAQCEKNNESGFTIKIKEKIYDGACNGIGAYLGFILHEICHVYMYEIGYTPILQRSFSEDVPVYMSVEWQVKALTGEVAIPYEESREMSVSQIIKKYNVSRGFALSRRKI